MYENNTLHTNRTPNQSQTTIRRILSNPLVILIAITYTLHSVYLFGNVLTNSEELKKTFDNLPKGYEIYSFFSVLSIVSQILFTALVGIGFFMIFANAKNYTMKTVPKSGSSVLVAGCICFAFYLVGYIGAELIKMARLTKITGGIPTSYGITIAVICVCFIVYILGSVAFIFGMRDNLCSDKLKPSGAILFGISNTSIAVLLLIVIIIYEKETGTYAISGDMFSTLVVLFAYIFISVFAFYYRITICNHNSGVFTTFNESNTYAPNPTPANSTTNTERNFCPACGNPLKSGQAFCGVCGYRLK